MKLNIWILLFAITFFGCKQDQPSKKTNFAYLGGQIINPKNNFVVLYKGEKILDTVILDGKSKFVYKLEDLEEGLYTFKHGDEFQMVLLEPNDSIMLRLNTLDFDESLVYTGEGSKKNNYFMNEFIQNENEEKKVFKYCQLDPISYEKRIESLKSKKNTELERFKNKYETSPLFNKIAQANIDYNYYFNKEVYPFVHYGKDKDKILKSIPEDFYAYRKDINYNDNFLKDYFTYQSFLRTNINNVSLENHLKHTEDKHVKRQSVCYTLDKLHLIDSLFTNKAQKNNFLYHYTINFLTKNKKEDYTEVVMNSFLEKSNDQEKNNLVKRYASSVTSLKAGNALPSLSVTSFNGEEHELSSLIDNTSVIYFWSHTNYNHFKESHNKIQKLRTKYPEVKFISLNIDNYNLETTKKTLKRNHLAFNNEFQFKNPEKSKEILAIYPLTKTIIVDSHKKIVESNANIFDIHFEEVLLGAINR